MPENNNNSIFSFQKNINISELIMECLKRWYIIVTATVAALVISAVFTLMFVTPMYSSTAKIMIFNKTGTGSANDMELSASTYLTRDFTEIISDKVILNDVSSMLNNKYTNAQLNSFITVTNPTNTRIIEISVLSPNAQDSKKIADGICTVAQEKLVELMGLDRITVISSGDVAKNPTSPNVKQNILIGTLIGIVLGCGIVFLIYATDNKVSSAEAIEKQLGISVLATIPYNNRQKSRK